jgi:membrane associated rhomboid family serine protease
MLGAYFILYPRARVITLVPLFILPWIVEIPALVYLGFWFLSQLFNGALSIVAGAQMYGGVAWWAHAGGFLGGTILVGLFAQGRYVRRVYMDEYSPW